MLARKGRQSVQCSGFFLGYDWRAEPIYGFCLWSQRGRAVSRVDSREVALHHDHRVFARQWPFVPPTPLT